MPFRHRLLLLSAELAAGTAMAVATVVDLAPYRLPGHLAFTCVGGVSASAVWLTSYVLNTVVTTTHRCTAPDCTYTIRVRGTTSAESRRWQEIAADHPGHHLSR
ncbi:MULTISPECIES: hypothetical protein [Streptomyces]|uniref:hypothetical protein n=1 Tax=Streptomyces TaxID=1883 RepID=UPI000B9DEA85|nr:hypothetical protein [Streptomyces kasugaensis]